MKKLLTVFVIFLIGGGIQIMAQAKQPKIMVVPSRIYCNKHGYMREIDNQGEKVYVEDFDKLYREDENMRQVISKIEEMIKDRNYTKIANLESVLQKLQQDEAELSAIQSKNTMAQVRETPYERLMRKAKADIIINVYFDIKKQGPRSYISFNIQGIDAYTNEPIASASGDGEPSFSATPGKLIEEAVLSHIDNFLAQLQSYFDEMFKIGRKVKIRILVWDDADFDLEEEYDYNGETMELSEILENWFYDNSVEGRYDIEGGGEANSMIAEVRIPLYDERKRPIAARQYARKLRKFLRGAPFNITSKLYAKGLGEAWIVLGGK